MNRELPPEPFIAMLDQVSRARALADHESVALEKAIRTGTVSKREAARLGMKRRMSHYRRPES